MKTLQLKQDFYWAGILDKNLRVLDIIMYTEFGTTYNSYILKAGDETILFETAKEKFFGDYRAALSEQLDIAQIDYIVVDHTEPDHAGSIAHIIAENPQAKIIATPTAITYCGIGTIGIVAASAAKEVIGVELNKDAVRDAVIALGIVIIALACYLVYALANPEKF